MDYLVAVQLVTVVMPVFVRNFSINFNLSSTFMHYTIIVFSL